eukprot:gnl/Spiro4/28693_TR14196_c0_g1_i1.p1 gnl/Spiro4/28693_TR14196_c0_g1~~gnl/Spiro4/28693_TR14196_c0_g1_i1.p1  ORF type:complete len:385 (+),score=16.37 gnl/Spiro4/28693_TR14196_c0_g1_i1:65-1219(+)
MSSPVPLKSARLRENSVGDQELLDSPRPLKGETSVPTLRGAVGPPDPSDPSGLDCHDDVRPRNSDHRATLRMQVEYYVGIFKERIQFTWFRVLLVAAIIFDSYQHPSTRSLVSLNEQIYFPAIALCADQVSNLQTNNFSFVCIASWYANLVDGTPVNPPPGCSLRTYAQSLEYLGKIMNCVAFSPDSYTTGGLAVMTIVLGNVDTKTTPTFLALAEPVTNSSLVSTQFLNGIVVLQSPLANLQYNGNCNHFLKLSLGRLDTCAGVLCTSSALTDTYVLNTVSSVCYDSPFVNDTIILQAVLSDPTVYIQQQFVEKDVLYLLGALGGATTVLTTAFALLYALLKPTPMSPDMIAFFERKKRKEFAEETSDSWPKTLELAATHKRL